MDQQLMDTIYTAGLFDGEGCISIAFISGTGLYRPNVCLINTNEEVVDWLVSTWGGNKGARGPVARSKDTFSWELWRKEEVGAFLTIVRPYLKIKAKQAEIMTQFLAAPKANRWDTSNLALKEELYQQMKVLNKRGKETTDVN